MTKFLKVLFAAIVVVMTYVIISTSKQSSLFELMAQWGDLSFNTYPWFSATLWDFYCNVVPLYCWICYKETAWWSKLLWLVLLVMWGSPATAAYILIQLYKLKQGEDIKALLVKQN